MNPPHPPNSSLVERLLAIPERKVGRLVCRSSVVRGEHDHRVLVDAGGFEGVHHLVIVKIVKIVNISIISTILPTPTSIAVTAAAL